MRYNKRRLSNRYALSVRHNDGIKDVASKIKTTAKKLIEEFKSLPRGRKVVVILNHLLGVVSAIAIPNHTDEVIKNISELKSIKKGLEGVHNDKELWDLLNTLQASVENKTIQEVESGKATKIKLLKGSLKLLISLVGYFTSIAITVVEHNTRTKNNNSEITERRDSMYYMKRTRHMDRRVRAIRHSDGIKDIALKIKEKATSLINEFKAMPMGKKIAYALTKLVQAVAGVYTAKNVYDLKKSFSEINKWKRDTRALTEDWQYNLLRIEEKAGLQKKVSLLVHGVNAIVGLATTLVAFGAEKFIKASGGDLSRGEERGEERQ